MNRLYKFLFFVFSILIVLALASCGLNPQAEISSSGKSYSQSKESSSVPGSSAPAVSAASPSVSGKIVPLGDARLQFPADVYVGSQDELEQWESLIKSDRLHRILVCNMNDAESELSKEQVANIISILRQADLTLYNSLGNPPTGGAIHIVAYESDDVVLWHGVYNGEWFMVSFGNSSVYVFNGEDEVLNSLSQEIY
jgi:hypothetical protein